MTAVACTKTGCLRLTRDLSGRCHDHRGAGRSTTSRTVVPAPAPTFVPSTGPEPGVKTNRYPDGTISEVVYEVDGQPHRDDGPARIRYTNDGVVKAVNYIRHGRLHRTDGPALTRYTNDGSLLEESWHLNGAPHRTGGPAETSYYPDGSKQRESWCRLGSHHRLDGPAVIEYAVDGTVTKEKWYFEGPPMPDGAEGARRLRRGDPGRAFTLVSETEAGAVLLGDGADLDVILGAFEGGVYSLEGVREVVGGAPVEWVRSFEEAR